MPEKQFCVNIKKWALREQAPEFSGTLEEEIYSGGSLHVLLEGS